MSFIDEWKDRVNPYWGFDQTFPTWGGTLTSFGGCDIKVIVTLGQQSGVYDAPKTATLGDLQTISYSVFRQLTPVNAFGHVHDKAHLVGKRTIAGSMIFSVFNRQVLSELLSPNGVPYHDSYDTSGNIDFKATLVDQLPPFDIVILFQNEAGNISRMALYGVKIQSEGQVMSISDLMTENSVTYMAKHIDPMTPILEIAKALDPNGGVLAQAFNDVIQEAQDFGGFNTPQVQQAIANLNSSYHNLVKSSSTRSTTLTAVMDEQALQLLHQSRSPWR